MPYFHVLKFSVIHIGVIEDSSFLGSEFGSLDECFPNFRRNGP